MFVISFLCLFLSKLFFEFANGQVKALIHVFTAFGTDKNPAVLAPCNYLNACFTTFTAVDNYFNLIDTVIVPRKF